MFYDRSKFFASLRTELVGTKGLTQGQVDGFEILLREGERRLVNTEWMAYVLATAWHETAMTMQPVRETLAKDDRTAMARLDKAWKSGKLKQVKTPYWRDGFFGRGYVQLTFEFNYRKMGGWLGIDLVKDPDLALDPDTAAKIIYEGMLRGMFTSKKLSDYLDGTEGLEDEELKEFERARAIINGKDKAKAIAGYALKIEKALSGSEIAMVASVNKKKVSSDEAVEAVVQERPPYRPKEKSALKSTTVWTALGTLATSIVGMFASLPVAVQVLLILAVAGFVFWIIRERMKGNLDISKLF